MFGRALDGTFFTAAFATARLFAAFAHHARTAPARLRALPPHRATACCRASRYAHRTALRTRTTCHVCLRFVCRHAWNSM